MDQWRGANREQLLAYNRTPEKRAKGREYMRRKATSGELRQYQREYARRFQEKIAEKRAKRRAKVAGSAFESVSRIAIVKRDGRLCYLCGVKLKQREVTLDHVIPLARGGTHTASNLRVACGPCNSRKQHRLLDEYATYLRSLSKSPVRMLPPVQVALL